MLKTFFMTATGVMALALVSLFAQAQTPAPELSSDVNAVIRAGTLEGSTYINTYFGLRLTFPDGWEVQDDRTKQIIQDRGKERLRFDDSKKQARLDESVANTANLLTLFETPFIQPYQAKLVCVVERIPVGSTFTEVNYATSLKTALTGYSKIKYVLEKDARTEMIDGAPFTAIDFTVNLDSGRSHQKYYTQIRKGYVLCFILSYASKRQLSALKTIIAGISLSQV
jgi:hypothetical protein